jgi:hypothetical protein
MVAMGRLWLKQKPIKLLIFITLALIISAPIVLPHQAVAQTNGIYDKSFAWNYNGKYWTWNLSIPQTLYDSYKTVPASTRTANGPAGYGFLTTTDDYYIQILAQKLNETATQQGYNSFDKVSFVLAFVQSLPYTSDSVTTGHDEYPRFPIETLVDDGGDCEDTSILFATLTLIMGYGTVYINPTGHYAVGVLGNNLRGTYWTHPENSNNTYYYCETTGDNFKIGQLPEEFLGQKAFIYDIDQSKQFISNVEITPTLEPSPAPTYSTGITSSTPSLNPNPTLYVSPSIAQPSNQPVLPLSINLISDNPLLFLIISFAIVASITLAIWSVRKTKQPSIEAPLSTKATFLKTDNTASESSKFCIFCGSNNKAYALYCEKCGKQIGQPSE